VEHPQPAWYDVGVATNPSVLPAIAEILPIDFPSAIAVISVSGEDFDPRRFDERVDHEGAAGLALAIPAVTAMDEHRRRGEPITQTAAGAAAG